MRFVESEKLVPQFSSLSYRINSSLVFVRSLLDVGNKIFSGRNDQSSNVLSCTFNQVLSFV